MAVQDEQGRVQVPVIVPTRDHQGAVAETVATLWNVIYGLGRVPVYIQFQSHGYSFVRTGCFRDVKRSLEVDRIRGFLIDDDILLKSSQQSALAAAIRTADQFDWNFVAPYRVRDGYVTITHENGQLMTPSEVRQFRPFDRVPNAGLGFYYGWIPLDYTFHEGGVFGGEDLNFFYDNPELEVRIFDLDLKHLKTVDLGLDTPMLMGKRPLTAPGKPRKKLKVANDRIRE